MLKLEFTKKALSALKKLPPKHRKQVGAKIHSLRTIPKPHDSWQLKGKLFKQFLCTDEGEYRIVYFVDNDKVYIQLIGKRNDGEIYKRLERALSG